MGTVSKVKNILTGGMVALLLLLGIFLIRGYLNGHFDSPETLRTYVGSFGPFSPVILTVIQALQVVLPVLYRGGGAVRRGRGVLVQLHRHQRRFHPGLSPSPALWGGSGTEDGPGEEV